MKVLQWIVISTLWAAAIGWLAQGWLQPSESQAVARLTILVGITHAILAFVCTLDACRDR